MLTVFLALIGFTYYALENNYESAIHYYSEEIEIEHENIESIINNARLYLALMNQAITHSDVDPGKQEPAVSDTAFLPYIGTTEEVSLSSPELREEFHAGLEIIPIVKNMRFDSRSHARFSYFSRAGFYISLPGFDQDTLQESEFYSDQLEELLDAQYLQDETGMGITSPYISPFSSDLSISFTIPVVLDTEGPSGFAAIEIPIHYIRELATELTGKEGILMILSDERDVLFASPGAEEFSVEEIRARLNSSLLGDVVFKDGKNTIWVSQTDECPWTLIGIIDTKSLYFIPVTQARFIILIIVMLFTGGLIYFIMKRSHRRVEEIAAKYQVSFDQSPLYLATLSPEGKILEANTNMLRFFDAKRSALEGTAFADLSFWQQSETLTEYVSQALEKVRNGDDVQDTLSGYTETGELIHTDFRLSQVKRSDGSLLLINMIVNDITKNVELQSALERESRLDHLTQLMNRRSYEEALTKEMARSRRYGIPLSLIIMDIDNFKKVNDNYGHDFGDYVLVQIAQILRIHTRSSDLVARWGGEEFIILMPETSQAEAALAAEKLRKNIEQMPLEHDIVITMSFGVAEWLQIKEQQTWFKRADRALYRAKEMGRNRVEQCIWKTVIPEGHTGLEWMEAYETGFPQIDKEHRELLPLASQLLDNMEDASQVEDLQTLLHSYIEDHFEYEERLMDRAEYPEREHHKEEHALLRQHTSERFKDLEKGLCENFYMFFIDEFILNHFFVMDKPFAEYLQNLS